MKDYELISLDLETSGSDSEKHTILSVGCVRLSDMSSFYSEVRHESFEMSPEATRVHQLDLSTRDDKKLPTLVQLDNTLRDWLTQGKGTPKKNSMIPMGMNVGTFDMGFVRKYLPKTASCFGYRSMDLNAILFLDSMMQGRSFQDTKDAARVLGTSYAHAHVPELQPHNALYDAFSNIGILYFVAHDEWGKTGEVVWDGGGLDLLAKKE